MPFNWPVWGLLRLTPIIVLLFHPQGLLADEQVSGAPILILGNKIDKPGAASEEELRTLFNVHSQATGKVSLLQ